MAALDKHARTEMLQVPEYAIERAVVHLSYAEALALIQGAYPGDDGGLASPDDARTIFLAIMDRYCLSSMRRQRS